MEPMYLSAFTGIVTSSTLLANLNYESFKSELEKKSVKYWWLLGVLMVLPLLITLFTIWIIFK
ncbi:hypothetical protein A2V80_02505 [Candidatus Woesebacteria bacterium RBG_16_39_8b]|uniref:Uncharacterized protein n=1 Tax=Candidatus Woesebacteria bacterium RBG_16_39_8b TaxID=1802482 RepID=A0A1F7XCZ6_9BACT|nr:MAG: hypothetical protein A2V80_02505 [Candidatus Woesebacteria bacterium RBG_16_39_8b]